VNLTRSFLQVVGNRKIAALLLLGFISGLPLRLTGPTLQAWMKSAGVDLGVIGWFSLVGLPYTLKFLWSPLLDRFIPPFLGRRRGWLLITQVGLLIAIATLGLQNPTQALQLVALNALMIAFLSASQDIAGDAYRTDVLEPAELGVGASTWVLGYRIAILVSGSLTLILADYLPWSVVYLLMAVLMLVGIVTLFWAPEPLEQNHPPESLVDAVYLPFKEFWTRLGGQTAAIVLLFILLYRLADALVSNMATPFLLDIGFSKTEIGAVQGTTGFLATTVGVIVGGVILTKIGTGRSLWVFGALQALSNLGYFALALVGKNSLWLLLAINLENFCGGLVTAVFVAYLMGLCHHAFTATQYALLSSLMALGSTLLAAPAGELAKTVGWSTFFLLTLAAAIPGFLMLPLVAPWNNPPPQNPPQEV